MNFLWFSAFVELYIKTHKCDFLMNIRRIVIVKMIWKLQAWLTWFIKTAVDYGTLIQDWRLAIQSLFWIKDFSLWAVWVDQHGLYIWFLPKTSLDGFECITAKEWLRTYCPNIYTVRAGASSGINRGRAEVKTRPVAPSGGSSRDPQPTAHVPILQQINEWVLFFSFFWSFLALRDLLHVLRPLVPTYVQ